MDSGEHWRLGRRPGLDGLRAIAVLLVVATHFDRGQLTPAGVNGVTVFFTLSGFLITTLLLEERQRTGATSLTRFYRRRALRLFPALAVMLAVVVTLQSAGWPLDVSAGMALSVVAYCSNWFLMATTDAAGVHWSAIGHTWSLAIEEQFYLLWPLVMIAVTRRGRQSVLAVAMAGAASSLVWGLVSGRPNLASDVSAYPLLVGCTLAAWMHQRPAARPSAWWAVVLVALVPLSVSSDLPRWVAQVGVPLVAAAGIWAAAQTTVPALTRRPLLWVGRRSYGLYLWHVPVAYLAFYVSAPWVVVTPLAIAVSFGLTALSWRFVETPFLRLKDGSGHGVPANWQVTRAAVKVDDADTTAMHST